MIQNIKQELQDAQKVLNDFLSDDKNLLEIENASNLIVSAFENGNKIISCGNGGSSCDAMHFAEELSGRYRGDRKALAAISISDSSHITCTGNDYGYEFVFSRFIEGLGQNGDILLAISTSGNSGNVIQAAQVAKTKGMKVIGLTGKNGGQLAQHCDVEIRVPHFGFADRVQEIHIKVIHILIYLIEKKLNLA